MKAEDQSFGRNGGCHDNLPYRTRKGTLGGVLGLGDVFVLKFLFNSRYFLLMIFFS